MGNQMSSQQPTSEKDLITLAHTVLNTMDKGDEDGKLIEHDRFKSALKKCVDSGKFQFFPCESQPTNCQLSTKLQQAPWDKNEWWCGEHVNQKPHGRVVIIWHGEFIELAHCRNGKLDGPLLYINCDGMDIMLVLR